VSLQIPVLLLQIKNQALERPALFITRVLAGGAFGVGAVALAGWFGWKLGAGTNAFARAFPAVHASGLRFLFQYLLTALLPLMAISQATVALAYLFKNPEIRFLLTLPLSRTRIFFSRGVKIFLTASGYFYLLFIPFLWGFGGVAFALKAMVPITLFLLITFFLGLLLILLLTSLFHVATLHRAFSFFFALFAVGFIFAFRNLHPETLFASPQAFVLAMNRPLPFPYSPASRAAKSLLEVYQGGGPVDGILLASCAGLFLAAFAAFGASYFRAFSRSLSQGRRKREQVRGRMPGRPFVWALVMKEWLHVARSPTRLSQAMLMASLLILYLFNMAHLPLREDPMFGLLYQGLHVFLLGFIISALGLRFAFPAPSLEGEAVVFFKSLPVAKRTAFAARSAAWFIPFLLISILLNAMAWRSLDLPASEFLKMNLAGGALALLASAGGVGMGMIHPRYKNANPLQVGFSPEGLAYFFLCLAATSFTAWLFLRSVIADLLK
jgi:ABC-2 type transport system permease protein